MNDNGQRRPEYIQADIERTRSNLSETLGAIERRLNPSELVDQGLDYLRHSGARQYVSNLGTAAKQDPVPLALVGVGLAWLMLSSLKQKAAVTTQRLSQTAHTAGERAKAVGEGAATRSNGFAVVTSTCRMSSPSRSARSGWPSGSCWRARRRARARKTS